MNILQSKEEASSLLPKTIWTRPMHFIACGFGSGVLPIMPGTYGTLVGIPLYLLMMHFIVNNSLFSWSIYIAITVVLTLIGVVICDRTAKDFGVHDHPSIVWDEIIGFLWTMVGTPVSWFAILLGFGLFRLFDILKPWPIGWVDKNIPGGIGIMLDDVMAAACAAVILVLLSRLGLLF